MKIESLGDMFENQKGSIEVLSLKNKISDLEHENEKLRKHIQDLSSLENKEEQVAISDAEALCMKQLQLLKDRALVQELTLEECKKAEIYIKSLNLVKSVPKKKKSDIEAMSSSKLLAILNTEDFIKE